MTLQELARISLQHLTEMSELVEDLQKKLGGHSPSDIVAFNTRFSHLQNVGQKADTLLLETLRAAAPDEETQILLAQRRMIQERLRIALAATLPQAKSIKLLLHNEMVSIRKGRNAMSGYNTLAGHRPSRIIDKRF